MSHPVAAPVHHAIGIEVAADHLPHQRFSPRVEHSFDVFLALVLFLELVLLFGNTSMRGLFNTSLVWANEVAEYALTSLAFIGGAVAYHRVPDHPERWLLPGANRRHAVPLWRGCGLSWRRAGHRD